MNHISKLEKRMDLGKNDGLCIYVDDKFGRLACMQNDYAFDVFEEFVKIVKPSNILEIGTAQGGFTCFLRSILDKFSPECRLLSYDIIDRPWFEGFDKHKIDIRIENVFLDEYTETTDYVKEFIQSPGVTIVLCDGAYKKYEFNLLSNFIKEGDFILAHDYGVDINSFNRDIKGKYWNWCELVEDDIAVSVKRNNLMEYRPDLFFKLVWTCKTK